jgi:hypothetical protein
MTHKVYNSERCVHLRQSRQRPLRQVPTTLSQLNAAYASRINLVLEQDRDNLTLELAAAFDIDQHRMTGQQ